jgi:hypothetical protein
MATLISSQAGEGVYGTHARTPLSVSIMIKLNNEELHRDYYVVKICDIFFGCSWMFRAPPELLPGRLPETLRGRSWKRCDRVMPARQDPKPIQSVRMLLLSELTLMHDRSVGWMHPPIRRSNSYNGLIVMETYFIRI